MSTAKAAIFDEINAMPDNLDELEIIDSLYHRVRLKQSRESIEEYGTLSTDEVREYFKNKREKGRVFNESNLDDACLAGS